jgi:hypothetical protein
MLQTWEPGHKADIGYPHGAIAWANTLVISSCIMDELQDPWQYFSLKMLEPQRS